MWFTPYPADGVKQERKRGRVKLHVPQFAGRKRRVHDLNLLLVPVVGMDRLGYRLGQAGGYYDATLRGDEIPFAGKNRGCGLCLPVGGQAAGRGARPAFGRVCFGSGSIVL